ncbi:carboxymuconolactone decarboxylase family protein [Pseudoroseomonas globiformis]|uniref:Carboxymuconolactone decarboxylase family protein n=1 Tax=Teichococcus globiformis TaxID=2307229 RepID=A0ABV7G6D0_9PROT
MRIDYMAAAPVGVQALGGVYGYIMQSGLDTLLVEMVNLRVSQINGCAYCLALHSAALTRRGVSNEKLALVQAWSEAEDHFDARERAALRWAETVTLVAQTRVPDEEFGAVSEFFSEKEVVDLTIAVGLMNSFNRLAISLRRPPGRAIAR